MIVSKDGSDFGRVGHARKDTPCLRGVSITDGRILSGFERFRHLSAEGEVFMPTVEGFLNWHAFTMTVESLGQIRVWKIEGRKLIRVVKRNYETRQSIGGYPFMKVLVVNCATHLNPDNERAKGESITAEEAERLSPEEAEQIAEEIIKHHEYLFEDQNRLVTSDSALDEQGNPLTEISLEKVEVEREDGKTESEYLYGLVLGLSEREEIGEKAAIERMSDTIRNLGNLNSSIADSFKMPDYRFLIPPPNPQHTTNLRLQEVLNALGAQTEVTVESIKKLDEKLEQRSDKWEDLFKGSSLQSTRQARFNNRIAVFVAILTLWTLVLGYLTYKVSQRNQNVPQVSIPAPAENPNDATK